LETNANYVAVGAFVLACVVGLVITILWLTGAEYSQEYSYYQTFFKGPVTGLGKGTVTRYNGIDVGRVTDLQFDPSDPQSVIVTLQVQPNLNIRENSVASIESQGLTGGTYVEISGGTARSPILVAKPGQKYPVIRAKQSTLQQLEQSAPEVVAKLNIAVTRLNDLLNDKNRQALSDVLTNLADATSSIAKHSKDIEETIRNTNQATANLRQASADLEPTLEETNRTIRKFGKTADDADAFIKGEGMTQLTDLVGEMRRLVASLTRFSDELDRDPSKLLFGDRRKGYQPK
jgi:phospholipid/cholesterol/gamma-HCH transport system substrate-binding protein